MTKKIGLVLMVAVVGIAIYAGVLFGGKFSTAMAATNSDGIPAVGFANPAAIYCADLGYSYEIVTTENGDVGVCTLPDNSACDEWDFLAGKCGAQYSLCAKQGYDLQVRNDGKGFTPEYAVCTAKDGKVIGSVSELAGLDEKARKSCSPGQEELRPNPFESAETEVFESIDTANPTSFDWRTNGGKNRLTNVRDQGGCGSCWAFSAVGTTEAALNIANNKTGNSYDLSEEYLVSDCHMYGGYQNCCGGWKDAALTYIKNSGIPDEACMTYVDGTGCSCPLGGPCSSSCTYNTSGKCSDKTCANRCSNWSSRLTKIAATGAVSTNREAIKTALIAKGPLAVSLRMNGSYDANNIYRCSPDSPTNHAVVIVGYNNSPGYWWVKNSWGTTFGTNGYFKVGYGECSIEGSVYYATAAKSNVPTLIEPNGTISDQTPTYKWTSVSGATKYEIQVYQGTTKVYSKTYTSTACSGSTCSGTPTNTLTYQTYKWQARAYIGSAWKPWSAWMNFTVSGVPTPISPSGTISDKTPTYKWSKVTGATQYRIQVDKGTTKVFDKAYPASACGTTTCQGTPTNTLGYFAYKWKVQAYIGGAWKAYSPYKSFTVSGGGGGPKAGFWKDDNGVEFYVTTNQASVDDFAIYVSVTGCGNYKITHTPLESITSNHFSFSGSYYASGTFDTTTSAHGTTGLSSFYIAGCGYVSGGPFNWTATWRNSNQPDVLGEIDGNLVIVVPISEVHNYYTIDKIDP